MGGGLAAEAAGTHAALVRAAVLLDPVNYALESANVPWTGLAAQAPRSPACPACWHVLDSVYPSTPRQDDALSSTKQSMNGRRRALACLTGSLHEQSAQWPYDPSPVAVSITWTAREQWSGRHLTQGDIVARAGTPSLLRCCAPACAAWTATSATRRQTASSRQAARLQRRPAMRLRCPQKKDGHLVGSRASDAPPAVRSEPASHANRRASCSDLDGKQRVAWTVRS